MLSIRPATVADARLILKFIRLLAEYEREPDAVIATEEDIIRDGFDPEPKYRCLIAEWDSTPAGFAFFFYNYSTWLGKPGLYLEDLFVLPEMRGKGIGKALLQELAKIAVRENCYGMRWQVLEWNEPALKFYDTLGAHIMDQLTGPEARLHLTDAQSPTVVRDAADEGVLYVLMPMRV